MRQDARAEEGSRREYREKCREVREVLEGYLTRLKTGDLKSEELRIEKSVRQKRNEYQAGNLTALALGQLEEAGIEIHPGEKIPYFIKDAKAKNKEERGRAFPLLGPDDLYDEEKYRELLLEAAEEILHPSKILEDQEKE